jgi:hypothetical protein
MAKVQHPGARGGQFWIDENHNIRYGQRPTGERKPQYPAVLPRQDEAQPPAAEGLEGQAHHQEFGPWSEHATEVYLRQALRFAPCLTNVIDRYLDMVSRYGLGAAAEAMKLVAPEDVPAATAALGRIRRLARWDRYGRVREQGTGTPLPSGNDPSPQSTATNPFVRAAMNAGMPQDAALLWQQLALRAMNRNQSGDLAGVLLAKHDDDPRLIWLAKAVMRPGSKGGHIYWKDGRLHYGIPSPPAHLKARGGGAVGQVSPPGPSALALALMRRGKRIEYTNSAGVKVWGDIVTAVGDILSVIPDDARSHDLLHTVAVPVQAVLRVRPDEDQRAASEGARLEKSDGDQAHQPLADQPDHGAAEDFDPFPAPIDETGEAPAGGGGGGGEA